MLYMDCTQAEAKDIVEYRKDVARAFERLERFMVWTVGLVAISMKAVCWRWFAPLCITLEVVGNRHTYLPTYWPTSLSPKSLV